MEAAALSVAATEATHLLLHVCTRPSFTFALLCPANICCKCG